MKIHLESLTEEQRKRYYKISSFNKEQLELNLAIRLFKLIEKRKIKLEEGKKLINNLERKEVQTRILTQNINGKNIWQRTKEKLQQIG